MLVLLHAGMNKTGSTAIQAYLSQHREQLRKIGAVYPDLGHQDHWRLFAATSSRAPTGYIDRRLARSAGKLSDQDVIDRLREQLAHLGRDDFVVLSHESFSTRAADHSRLSELLEAATGCRIDLQVIAYARNPLDLFVSDAQHKLKGAVVADLETTTWKSGHPGRGKMLRRTFGERLTLRAHDRTVLRGNDVVSDFRAWVSDKTGCALPPPQATIAANVSFSGPACGLLALWAQQHRDRAPRLEFGRLKQLVISTDRRGAGPRLVLPSAWRGPLIAVNGRAWNKLVDDMDHSTADKDGLRIDLAEGVDGGLRGGVTQWMLGYLDVRFVAEVIEIAREQGFESSGVPAWLNDVRRRIAAGDAPDRFTS